MPEEFSLGRLSDCWLYTLEIMIDWTEWLGSFWTYVFPSIQSAVPDVLAIRNLTFIYYSFLDHSSNTYTLSETKLKAKPLFIKPTYAC